MPNFTIKLWPQICTLCNDEIEDSPQEYVPVLTDNEKRARFVEAKLTNAWWVGFIEQTLQLKRISGDRP